MGRPKKAPTAQVRIDEEVVEQAWRVAALKGYRQVGEFLTDLLRPLLAEMERDLLSEQLRRTAPPKQSPPAGLPKPKGGKPS
jgi:hypothetical protein